MTTDTGISTEHSPTGRRTMRTDRDVDIIRGMTLLSPRQQKIVLAKSQFPHLTFFRLAQRHRVTERTIQRDVATIKSVLPELAYLFAR